MPALDQTKPDFLLRSAPLVLMSVAAASGLFAHFAFDIGGTDAAALCLLAGFTSFLIYRGARQDRALDAATGELALLKSQLEDRVKARTAELELTITNHPHGIVLLSPEMEVLVSNQRASQLLEVRDGETLDSVLPGVIAHCRAIKPQPGHLKRAIPLRVDISRPSGQIIEVGRIELPNGQQVVTLNDITALKRRQAELEQATLAATSASRTKSQFLSTMSHEMRTPLNGVIGALDLMMDTPLSADQRMLLETAICSGEALLVHINDVLDFSKMEAGKLELHPAAFNFPKLVESVVRIVEPQAKHRNSSLSTKVGATVPKMALGDEVRLRQILLNLAGNAAKFTYGGVVSVEVQRVGGSDERPELEFSVIDTGPGIPACKIGSMFQEFSMLDASYTRREGGTGLGLAICKRLVSAMGGTIGVESEEGKGSRFWFRVTLERAIDANEEAQRAAALQSARAPSIPPLNVLLVDDSSVNRMIGVQMLVAGGHTVETAVNGVEAVEKAALRRYDVILMDISMPEMDGIEATKRIRLMQGTLGTVPIVALTANAIAGERERFLSAGMDEYVTKPYRRGDIERVLATIMASPRAVAA